MRMLAGPQYLARRSVGALREQWPLALVDDIEGIHQTRVASRRLRELLPALASDPDDGQSIELRRRLRYLTRLLGPSRELDVAGQTLEALESRTPSHAIAIAIVRASVDRERSDASRMMRHGVAGVDIDGLAVRTRELAARLDSPGAIRACAGRAAARLDRRAHELEAAVLGAGVVYAPGPLHGVRIALKKFRYAFEVAQRVGRFRLRGSMQQLKWLQTLLGDLHDLQVLAARVRDVVALSQARRRPALVALVNAIDDDIRILHSRFVTDRASLVRVLARAARVRDVLGSLPASDRSRACSVRGRARGRLRED
jgi:CHAD domain-containing protein